MIVTRVSRRPVPPGEDAALRGWPFTLPPVAQILHHGLTLDQPVTFLVGENGSGKSTIVEAIAEAYGVDVRGGHTGRRHASAVEKSQLSREIRLDWTKAGLRMVGRKANGYFLRAETSYGYFAHVSGTPGYGDRDLLAMSHGESFLTVFDLRFDRPGLYLMDEPESALSFTACLRLLSLLDQLRSSGSQVVCATHLPLLAALPDAQILELGEHGIRPVPWDKLELVDHWRRFLHRPDAYLTHLLDRTDS